MRSMGAKILPGSKKKVAFLSDPSCLMNGSGDMGPGVRKLRPAPESLQRQESDRPSIEVAPVICLLLLWRISSERELPGPVAGGLRLQFFFR